jgi:hypothetical protein
VAKISGARPDVNAWALLPDEILVEDMSGLTRGFVLRKFTEDENPRYRLYPCPVEAAAPAMGYLGIILDERNHAVEFRGLSVDFSGSPRQWEICRLLVRAGHDGISRTEIADILESGPSLSPEIGSLAVMIGRIKARLFEVQLTIPRAKHGRYRIEAL